LRQYRDPEGDAQRILDDRYDDQPAKAQKSKNKK